MLPNPESTPSIRVKRLAQRLASDKDFRAYCAAIGSMSWNLLYGVFNGVLGVVYGSVWFMNLFVYYMALGCMRLSVVWLKLKRGGIRAEKRVMLVNGIGLLFLAVVLSGMTCLSFLYPTVKERGSIIMIAIAAYTFYMATLAVIHGIKVWKHPSPALITLRNISCAGAVASLLSLSRSMLATFGDSTGRFSQTMQGAAGMGGFLIITALGISMICLAKGRGRRE